MGLCAQKQIDHQSLYWIRYYNQLSLDARLNWSNEIEDRRFLHNSRQHHLILHSRLHYKLNKNTDLGLGFTYSLQSPQDPESHIHPDRTGKTDRTGDQPDQSTFKKI